MPRACSVCSHADRALIDVALLENRSLRDVAAQFSVSKDSLSRHREHGPVAVRVAVPLAVALPVSLPSTVSLRSVSLKPVALPSPVSIAESSGLASVPESSGKFELFEIPGSSSDRQSFPQRLHRLLRAASSGVLPSGSMSLSVGIVPDLGVFVLASSVMWLLGDVDHAIDRLEAANMAWARATGMN